MMNTGGQIVFEGEGQIASQVKLKKAVKKLY